MATNSDLTHHSPTTPLMTSNEQERSLREMVETYEELLQQQEEDLALLREENRALETENRKKKLKLRRRELTPPLPPREERAGDEDEERVEGGARDRPPPSDKDSLRYLTEIMGQFTIQAREDRESTKSAITSLTTALANQTRSNKEQREADRLAKLIPQVPVMSPKEDIAEYLELFEQTQVARGVPPEAWSQALVPLLNQTCKDSILNIPVETRLQYADLKDVLLANVSLDDRSAAKKFASAYKVQNQTWRQTGTYMEKQLRKFARGNSADEIRNQVLKESLIQLMPVETAAYVRERKPNTWEEAADLAANHFMAHNVNQTNWEGQRPRKDSERYSLFRYRSQYQSNRQNCKFRGDTSSPRGFESKTYTRPPGNQESSTPKSSFKGDRPFKQSTQKSVHFSQDSFSKDSTRDRSQVTCWKCREKGHYASECTTVMRFSVPSLLEMSSKPVFKTGKIGTKKVEALMDSGADVSIIAKHLLPTKFTSCGPVWVKVFGGQVQKYPTVVVPATLEGTDVDLFCAVAPASHLPNPVIIGRNIPGYVVRWTVDIQPAETQTDREEKSTEETVTTSDSDNKRLAETQCQPGRTTRTESPNPNLTENNNDKPVPEQKDVPAQQLTQHPEPTSSQLVNTFTNLEMLNLEELKPAEILAVRTRAQRKRQEKQQREDDQITEQSEATITPVFEKNSTEDRKENGEPMNQQQTAITTSEEVQITQPEKKLDDTEEPEESEDEEEPEIYRQETNSPETPQAPEVTFPFTRAELIKEQGEDNSLVSLFQDAQKNGDSYFTVKDSILYARDLQQSSSNPLKIVVPEKLKKHVLTAGHDCRGHFGKNKTRKHIADQFYWIGMGKDVAKFCKECITCARFGHHKKEKQKMTLVPTVATPWKKIAVDVAGPFTRTKRGFKYLLTVIDYATRYPEAIPLKRVDAETTAQALLDLFSKFDVPAEIVSDNGKNFTAKMMEHLLKALKIHHIKTSPYHPEANGLVERLNGVIKKTLVKAGAKDRDWDLWLPKVLMAVRTTPHSSTGFSPFQLMFGRQPNTSVDALREYLEGGREDIPQNVHSYLKDLCYQLSLTQQLAGENERTAREKSKKYQDQGAKDSPLQVGDMVLAFEPRMRSSLSAKWEGPYPVTHIPGDLTYILDVGKGKTLKRHRNCLRKFHPLSINAATVIVAEEEREGEEEGLIELAPQTSEGSDEAEIIWEEVKGLIHLEGARKQELTALLKEYEDLFQSQPGHSKLEKFPLDTQDSPAISQYPYRMPLKWKAKVEEEIEMLLKAGIIRPSVSPWSSPVVPVMKTDKSVRMCIDFRQINKLTKLDKFPLPRVDDLLARVSKAKYISLLDLCKGYYQIGLEEEAIAKTAFITHCGKYEFTRLPFGLVNAPAFFQRQMNKVLKDGPAEAYIDDIAVYSDTWEEHVQHLRQTLEACREYNLTVKLKKCQFASAKLNFLGHTIGSGTLVPQQGKLDALTNYPMPRTKKGLRSFLGLIAYQKQYIPDFAITAAGLYGQTKQTSPERVEWTDQLKADFEKLKADVTTAPILVSPELDEPFYLFTDACGTGIGAVLKQKKDGVFQTIAYFSKKLLPYQKNYAISEMEALAVVEAIKHFKAYLYGAQVTVFTDHQAISFIRNMKNGNPRLVRWALGLQPFNCNYMYLPGAQNLEADALSRAEWSSQPETPPSSQEGGDVGYHPTH